MEKIHLQYQVNVVGVLETTKTLLPHFRENGDGVIINMSSISGRMGIPLGVPYYGSKFAVEGITESLYYEMAEIGVRVKIIEPGMIDTQFSRLSYDFSNDEDLKEYQGLIRRFFGGWGKEFKNSIAPLVVAELIYEAANDESDRLRYMAGDAAVQKLFEDRKTKDDESFFAGLKEQLGL